MLTDSQALVAVHKSLVEQRFFERHTWDAWQLSDCKQWSSDTQMFSLSQEFELHLLSDLHPKFISQVSCSQALL